MLNQESTPLSNPLTLHCSVMGGGTMDGKTASIPVLLLMSGPEQNIRSVATLLGTSVQSNATQ